MSPIKIKRRYPLIIDNEDIPKEASIDMNTQENYKY